MRGYEVVYVQVGQKEEEAIRLKFGEKGPPEGVMLLVVQYVAPDREKAAKINAPSLLKDA